MPATKPSKHGRKPVARAFHELKAGWLAGAATLAATPARAAEAAPAFDALQVMQLAIFAGAMGAALLSAIWLIRERQRTAAENLDLRGRVGELTAEKQLTDAMLGLKDQRVVSWRRDAGRPEIAGALPSGTGAPDNRGGFLAWGRWLEPASATALEHAIEDLRADNRPFDLSVETTTGAVLDVQGRPAGLRAFVRFAAVAAGREAEQRLRLDHQRLLTRQDLLSGLIAALPYPAWFRGADSRLVEVNPAYAAAVESADPAAAIDGAREFLSTQAREQLAQHHQAEPVFARTLSTVVHGDRRMYAVTEFAGREGSAGIAVDMSETEMLKAEIRRIEKNHAETLDQLTTAVAIFDAKEKLRFYNQAFQKLWALEPAFLESAPDNTVFLDRLRSAGVLPEQPEWRRWKDNLLSAYRSLQPQEHWWYLPDGRTIRVIANPLPQGGVTWAFENVTERLDLETRYNAAIRVQGETIDNLVEGVAVFGSDGRLRLWNPSFVRLWGLDAGAMNKSLHVSAVGEACAPMARDNPWGEFIAIVTGFDDERRERHGRVELVAGAILSWAMVPLPNGQVMITFMDVTDSVNVERALQDKNEALERAARLRNDFVQHVSYELRSPLTNIIGFAELLAMAETGALTPKQGDYVDHIKVSSGELMTIINDILDLATIDAGVMELEPGDVAVADLVHSATDLVAERMKEHGIAVETDLSQAPASFSADGKRVRQVLFNLLANAANYAPTGSTVRVACRAVGDRVEFTVADDGPGMPEDVLAIVFERFSRHAGGSRRRGAGLGLSIVKAFVELHGGSVAIDTGTGRGTVVTCSFPGRPALRDAAE